MGSAFASAASQPPLLHARTLPLSAALLLPLSLWLAGSGPTAPLAGYGAHPATSTRPQPRLAPLAAGQVFRPMRGGGPPGRRDTNPLLPQWPPSTGPRSRAALVYQVLDDMRTSRWEKTYDLRPVKAMVRNHWDAPVGHGPQREELGHAADALLALIAPSVPEFSAWDIGQTMDVLVELSAWDPVFRQRLAGGKAHLVEALCARVTKADVLPKVTSRQGSKLVSALGKMGVRQDPTVRALIVHLMQQPLAAPDVSRILWGLVKLDNPDPDLLSMLAYNLAESDAMESLDARSTSTIAWAFARLEVPDTRLMTRLADYTLSAGLLPSLTAQEAANLGWAFARLDVQNDPLMTALSLQVQAPGFLDSFGGQEIANTVWAFAKLGRRDEALLGAVALRAMDEQAIATFSAPDLATTAWAYAKLEVRDRALMSAIAVQAVQPPLLTALSSQDVATLAWAYATLDVYSEALMVELSQRALQPGFLQTFNPQDLATMAWAYAKLGLVDRPLMKALASRAMEDGFLERCQPENLANLKWAYSRVSVEDAALQAALQALLPS